MKLHWIRFVNIAKFSDTRIDFENRRLIAVTGTNGIGKTHLIQGLSMLLWGKKARGKKLYTLYDTMSWGAAECQIEGEFTHRGQRYYASRVVKAKGKSKSSTAELFKVNGTREDTPIAGPSTSAFDEKIPGLFGTLDVFLACVVAAQKGAGDLLEADRSERYDVFAEMTGAKELMTLGEQAKERQKLVWSELQACSGSASLLRAQAGDLEQLEKLLEVNHARLVLIDTDLQLLESSREILLLEQVQFREKAARFEAATTRLSQLMTEQSRLRSSIQSLRHQINEATAAKGSLVTLEEWITRLRAAETEQTQLREMEKTWGLLSQQIQLKTSQLKTEQDAIAAEEASITYDLAEAGRLDSLIGQWAQAKTAWDTAMAQETNRKSALQIATNDSNAIYRELTNLSEQAKLAEGVPAPEGVCRSCRLVGHALAAKDRLGALGAQHAEAVSRCSAYATPIPIPAYNAAEHNRVLNARAALGDPTRRQDALFSRKRVCKEHGYELEDLQDKLAALAYDPEHAAALEHDIKLYASAPEKKAVAAVIAAKLPELEAQHAKEEPMEAAVTTEIEQIRRDFNASESDEIANKLAQIGQDLVGIPDRIKELQAEQSKLLGIVGAQQEGLDKGRRMIAEAEHFEAQKAYWNAKWDRLGDLKKVFSKTGVLPIIIRKVAPEIEAIADSMLESVWASLGRLRIVTASDSGREIIDIFVETGGEKHPVELYSGGEETILRIVLRLAIGRWRAMRSGQSYDLLGFDEAFDALAPENAGKVLTLLQGMLEFVDQVLVISHTDDTVLELEDKLLLEQDGGNVTATWRK